MLVGAVALVAGNILSFAAAASEVVQDLPSILANHGGLHELAHVIVLSAASAGLVGLRVIFVELQKRRTRTAHGRTRNA